MSIPGFRVSTDQPGLIFSGLDGRGFRNSSTLLLSGSQGLTKIWERGILQGEEQGAACCGAGPPARQIRLTRPRLKVACAGVAEVGGCKYRVATGPSGLPSGEGMCAKLGHAELNK